MPYIRLPGGSTLSEQGAVQLKNYFLFERVKADTVPVGQVQLYTKCKNVKVVESRLLQGKFQVAGIVHRLVDDSKPLEQGSAADVRLQCTQH